MSASAVTTWRWTADAFERAGEAGIFGDAHADLIDGEVHVMSPQSPLHAAVLGRLVRTLGSLSPEHVTRVQMPVRLASNSELEPDLAVVRGPLERYDNHHPGPDEILLVVEVAINSLGYDSGLKLAAYARSGVPEAWVIDVPAREVLVHTSPEPARAKYARVETVADGLVNAAGVEIPVGQLWPGAAV